MSVKDMTTNKVLSDRTIAKFRVNFVSISIVPLASDGIGEVGHDVVDLKEDEIDADAKLLAELQRIAEAKLKALTKPEDMLDKDSTLNFTPKVVAPIGDLDRG